MKKLVTTVAVILLFAALSFLVSDGTWEYVLINLSYMILVLFVATVKNPHFFRYGFKTAHWMTSRQIVVMYLGTGIVGLGLAFDSYDEIWGWLADDKDPSDLGTAIGCFVKFVIGIAGAFLVRYAFRKNMPENPADYEAELQKKEEMDTWVVIAEFNDGPSAHIVKSMLESHGLEVYLYGENAPLYLGAGSHITPIRLCVRKHQKETAERLVNE